jgi:hypothetical protein
MTNFPLLSTGEVGKVKWWHFNALFKAAREWEHFRRNNVDFIGKAGDTTVQGAGPTTFPAMILGNQELHSPHRNRWQYSWKEVNIGNAISVYHDGSNGVTTATVQVDATDIILDTDVVAEDLTIPLGFSLGTVDTVINNGPTGWTSTLLTGVNTPASDLSVRAATNALSESNTVILLTSNGWGGIPGGRTSAGTSDPPDWWTLPALNMCEASNDNVGIDSPGTDVTNPVYLLSGFTMQAIQGNPVVVMHPVPGDGGSGYAFSLANDHDGDCEI